MGFALALAGVLLIVASVTALAADRIDVYPLDTCAVAKSKLGGMGEPVVIRHEGREFRFCCAKCTPKFEAEPAKFIASVDERIIAQQKKVYPLTTCPISGEKLGDTAVDFVVNNRLVRTCCPQCKPKVIASPAETLAKIDAAMVEAQLKCYPLTTCPVSGEALDAMGGPVDVLVGHRLIRLCCKNCKEELAKDPQKALAAVEAAWKTTPDAGKGEEKEPSDKKPEEKKPETGAEKKPEEGAKPKPPPPGDEKMPEGGTGG